MADHRTLAVDQVLEFVKKQKFVFSAAFLEKEKKQEQEQKCGYFPFLNSVSCWTCGSLVTKEEIQSKQCKCENVYFCDSKCKTQSEEEHLSHCYPKTFYKPSHFAILRVCALTPPQDEMCQVIERALECSDTWCIPLNNIYLHTEKNFSFHEYYLSVSERSESLLSNLLNCCFTTSIPLLRHCVSRGLTLRTGLHLETDDISLCFLDLLVQCNKGIFAKPVRNLKTGKWLERKGIPSFCVYAEKFLDDVCFQISSYGLGDDYDPNKREEAVSWFSDRVSCPFWEKQSWEAKPGKSALWENLSEKRYWHIEATKEKLEVLRDDASLLWKQWFEAARKFLSFHFPAVLVSLIVSCFVPLTEEDYKKQNKLFM